MTRGLAWMAVAALCACEEPPPPRPAPPPPSPSSDTPILWDADRVRPAGRAERRRRKRRFGLASVYVDGGYRGAIKFHELPPGLPTIWQTLDEGKRVIRFAHSDYIESLGVDLAKVKAVHYHGGRGLVMRIEGDEIRRVGRAFRFSFTRGNAGKVRIELPDGPLAKSTSIDKFTAMAIYVDKTPPTQRGQALYYPSGKKVEGVPYSDGERHGGTRVYHDGVFVGVARRRHLTPAMFAKGATNAAPRYALKAFLASLKVDLAKVKRVRFVSLREKVLVDAETAAMPAGADGFTLPQHSRGRVVFEKIASDPLSSVLLYSNVAPVDRTPPGGSSSAHVPAKKPQ